MRQWLLKSLAACGSNARGNFSGLTFADRFAGNTTGVNRAPKRCGFSEFLGIKVRVPCLCRLLKRFKTGRTPQHIAFFQDVGHGFGC